MDERFNSKSSIIASKLVFSHWDKIFKDPLTTDAAIERLVHRCTRLALTCPIYRVDHALGQTCNENTQEPV